MSDVFLSYAFTERPRAMAVRATLIDDGWTVWMDNGAGEHDISGLVEALGVPPGQEYNELINRAIEEAAYVVVLDSETYRSRPHCLEELEHAQRCGKPIVLLDGAEPDLKLMHARRELADAHGRLFPTFRGDEPAGPGRLMRWLLGDPRASDARLLAAADLAAAGMSLPDGGPAVLDSIEQADQQGRRSRRAGVVMVLTVLTFLAVIAVAARFSAVEDRREATRTKAAASSLELANRALRTQVTEVSLRLAGEAVRAQRNDVSTAALRQVEAIAARVRLLQVPAGVNFRAALSPDASMVALVRRDSVLVVEAETSKVITAQSPIDLRRRALVTARDVLVLDITGALRSVDIRSGTVEQVAEGPFEDFAIDHDGALWLLGNDGSLLHRGANSSELTRVTGHPVFGEAMVVDSELRTVYVLSGSVVSAQDYEAAQGNTPELLPERWSTAIDKATPTRNFLGDGHVGGSDASQLSLCGHNIAVSQGWEVLNMPGQRHVMMAPDGTLAEHWSFNGLYNGLGCGPDGTAWTQGLLEFHAESFDPHGWAPLSVGSDDTVAHALAIASLPEGQTVVVESTGVMRLFSPVDLSWSRNVGNVVAAQPLEGGVAYARDSGALVWDPSGPGPSYRVGEFGGVPHPRTAATADTWFLTVNGRVVRVDPNDSEPVQAFRATTARLRDVTVSPDGLTVCASTDTSVLCFPAKDTAADPVEVQVPLSSADRVATAEWNQDRLIVTTIFGRILLLNHNGAVIGEVSAVPGASAAIFSSMSGEIVAATGDGFLRRYDEDLNEVRLGYVQVGGLVLRRVDDDRLLLGTSEYDIQLVDTQSVSVLGLVQHRSVDVRTVVPHPSGELVYYLTPTRQQEMDDTKARLTVVPLPGNNVVLPD